MDFETRSNKRNFFQSIVDVVDVIVLRRLCFAVAMVVDVLFISHGSRTANILIIVVVIF